MKTIIITGPSGSGKTYLTNRISDLFEDSIVIKTDSYYRDSLLIKFLSIFQYDIYDKLVSIKKKKLRNTLTSINKKERLISTNHYDFKKRQSFQSKINFNFKGEKQFLILEGIFAHRLNLNYKETFNILCHEDKKICLQRRLNRDLIERGRKNVEVNKKFVRSWYLFYKNINEFLNIYNVIKLNPVDKNSFDKLIHQLENIKN